MKTTEITKAGKKKLLELQFADEQFWKLDRPYIMGIVNVTPDSFYDGGLFGKTRNFLKHIESMLNVGVDVIDIGGESSRPGALPISIQEERKRVIPKVKIAKKTFPQLRISVDTYKSEIAEEAIENGADIINDISSGENSSFAMFDVVLKHKTPIILMHKKGSPATMQKNPQYKNVVKEIGTYLKEKRDILMKRGFSKNKILLDVGIGFGKLAENNIELVKNMNSFKKLGCGLVVGASMKSIIAHILDSDELSDRGSGSLGFHLAAILNGAHIIRVHDVKASIHAIKSFFSVVEYEY